MTELKPLTTFKYTTDILQKLVEEKHWSAEDAMKFLNEIPTADVVEVVRCKDCEWYREVQGYEYKGRKAMCCFTHSGLRYETDYCSYGERRSENEG